MNKPMGNVAPCLVKDHGTQEKAQSWSFFVSALGLAASDQSRRHLGSGGLQKHQNIISGGRAHRVEMDQITLAPLFFSGDVVLAAAVIFRSRGERSC
jgi:hypothetical protein